MEFVDLGSRTELVSFETALRNGIANDGSLYFPETIPRLRTQDITDLVGATPAKTAQIMLTPWLGNEIPLEDLQAIIERSATFETPLVQVGNKHVLELFHGPTMAFKDVAARFLAAFMSYYNERTGATSTVLVATSGDTGGAIAHGFGDVPGIRVVVSFPKGRVSELQYDQLTRVADNIISLEVDGSFDDCQDLVKQAFKDKELSARRNLTSANSISIGRLLPQIIYYANAYGQLPQDDLRFVVPTGNLGNLSAGVLARAMGVPIKSFLAAHNQNDALGRYLETGRYEPRKSVETMSNAMDVGAPNNLPRFIELFSSDLNVMRATVEAATIDDASTIATIKKVHEDHGYLLDPHTAVAWAASEAVPSSGRDIIVSTASPVKFSKEIKEATGIDVSNKAELAKLRAKASRVIQIANDLGAFKAELNML